MRANIDMKLFPESATLDDKIQLTVIALLRFSTLIALIYLLAAGQLSQAGISAIALVLLFIPDFISRRYRVHLPVAYSFLIVLFIYGSIVLGELVEFYDRFWWWDDLLHTSFGVIFGFAGFVVLYILKLRGDVKASNFLLSFFALSVAVMVGAFWEVAELTIDTVLGTNMQKSVSDTSIDLITDTVGALFSVYLGYQFMKKPQQNKDGLFARMVRSLLTANPRIGKRNG